MSDAPAPPPHQFHWRAMESAPRDGTRILVVDEDGEMEITEWYVMERDDYVPAYPGADLYRKVKMRWHEGWNGNGHHATHWMPLPEPPEPAP